MNARHEDVPWMRFWRKVSLGDGCWEWLGYRNPRGYGRAYWDGKGHAAHRVSYEMFNGLIPAGLTIDHLCRNRACVNPTHLEAVTCRVNILRGETLAAKNAAVVNCPQGHPYDLDNCYAWGGLRYCKACRRERQRSWYAATRPVRIKKRHEYQARLRAAT